MPKKNRLASRMNRLDDDIPVKHEQAKRDSDPPQEYFIQPKTSTPKASRSQNEKKEAVQAQPAKKTDHFENSPTVISKKSGISAHSALIKIICLAVVSVYVCFLIFGLISTKYSYDDNGNVVPVVYSVKELSALDEYMKFASYFNRFQDAYKLTIEYDAQISDPNCNHVDLAMKYRTLLDGTIDKILIDINAAERSEGYSTLYNGLASTTNELAIYLQKIEIALYNKDIDSINEADMQQSILYQNYYPICKQK